MIFEFLKHRWAKERKSLRKICAPSTKGADMLDRKFWFLIAVMVAAIALGGVFMS